MSGKLITIDDAMNWMETVRKLCKQQKRYQIRDLTSSDARGVTAFNVVAQRVGYVMKTPHPQGMKHCFCWTGGKPTASMAEKLYLGYKQYQREVEENRGTKPNGANDDVRPQLALTAPIIEHPAPAPAEPEVRVERALEAHMAHDQTARLMRIEWMLEKLCTELGVQVPSK